MKYNEKLQQYGFIKNIIYNYSELKSSYCSADKINSMVIDPGGNVYKCWCEIDICEYKIGNILDHKLKKL
ncbi:SPASM domain-containing protein [Tepidimicrobium xylanilyticum]|uniref:SPASM domain-containing protein n=1 Tax=Tepidimicrobium xylanilyticum TaxID=1123352 RepID=UPI00264C74CB|nr:SPASM domain-containing protein [Tepidimicrobium xylanilyticum]GMG96773.1 hypothetical protein EN5CB1_15990 [Tepidimicrobium xylanilyticum]